MEELKKEFYEFIDKSPIGLVAKEFPDVTALIWVLNTLGADDSDMELEEHYEKIEQLTVENHELLTVVEDLKKMLILLLKTAKLIKLVRFLRKRKKLLMLKVKQFCQDA